MNLIFVFLTILIPIVCSTSLPADRSVCKTKKVLIVQEVTVPISLDFISEPQEISSIVKQECDSWRIVHSLSRRRRNSLKSLGDFLQWLMSLFSKAAPSLAKITSSVIKNAPRVAATIGKSVVKHGKIGARSAKILGSQAIGKVKHALKTIKKIHDLDGEPSRMDDLITTYFTMFQHLKEFQEKAASSTSSEENTLTYEGFQRDISNVLNQGTLGDFLKIAPDLIEDLNATVGYTIPNDDFFHYVKPKNVRCDSSTSISFEIDLFEQGSKILHVDSCEDIGFLNSANKYVYNILPEMTFSNYSGEFELVREHCKGDEKMLICDPSAIRRSDCSVRQIGTCDIRELGHSEMKKRRERFGAPEIVNLDVPHSVALKELLKIGGVIQIQGRTKVNSKWFSVDLIDRVGDIPLHINPRFDSQEVVLNSSYWDDWKNEEAATEAFPFKDNHDFTMSIIRGPYHYEIWVNGRHLASFAHRSHPDRIAHIRIDGDLTLQKVTIV